MCISYCFWPIHITNLQAINAMGRSDIFLRLELVKKGMSVAALGVGMCFSVYGMVMIKALQDFLCTFVNAAPNRKLLGYRIGQQWMDVMPSAGLSFLMCMVVLAVGRLFEGMFPLGRLAVQISSGAVLYAGLAWLFQMDSFWYLARLIMRKERTE